MDFYITSGVRLSASKNFWIGDPSFLFSTEEWRRFCQLLESSKQISNMGTVRVKNKSFVYWKASRGKGNYILYRAGEEIGSCVINSGVVCIIPYKLVRKVFKPRGRWKDLGHIIERRPYHPIIRDGDCQWGDYELYTGNDGPELEPL